MCLSTPAEEDRRRFFSDLILVQAVKAPFRRRKTVSSLQMLPLAQDPGPWQLTPEEQRRLEEQEENTLRELRLFLRDVTRRLATDKRFQIFSKPVDIEEVSDYLEVIIQPMDLSTIMTKIDTHKYTVAKDFLVDIDLICSNALEYNPDKDPGDKIIRHRACSLKDTAHAMITSELDPEFNRMCEEIEESRRKRGCQAALQLPVTPSPVVTREAAGEEAGLSSAQGDDVDKFCSDNIKRKLRRRPIWGGHHQKKKSYKKEEDDDPEDEDGVEDLAAMTQGDACLTLDESSCDTMELRPDKENLQANGHALSTEEENSCEPTASEHQSYEEGVKQDTSEKAPNGTTEAPALPVPQECVNGNESMDSLDSESHGGGQEVTAGLGSISGGVLVQKPAQCEEPAPEFNAKENATVVEICDADCDEEESSERKTCAAAPSEEQQPELPPSPAPVVDHQRLKSLLQQVVVKSAGLSVDHLERLYSVLSRCIYQHRRDYDKTRLIQAMEKQLQHFETFL